MPLSEHIIETPPSPEDSILLDQFKRGQFCSLESHELHQEAVVLSLCPDFGVLLAPSQARGLDPYEHQLETLRRVLGGFHGRALLCDEVGLGKTIEAGLCLLELTIRRLVRRVLILTPPSLIFQWQEEMNRKFGLSLQIYAGETTPSSVLPDRLIASFHTAKMNRHRPTILNTKWDMIIIDEAHHFRNRHTALWRFASELRSTYFLLLTATPVQNDLTELFNLIQILRPGHLQTLRQFERHFITKGDRLQPKNTDQLHSLLAKVIIRNRRSATAVGLTHRIARTLSFSLSPAERQLYDDLTHTIKNLMRSRITGPNEKKNPAKIKDSGASILYNRMTLMRLQAQLGSSPSALAASLERLKEKHLELREPLAPFFERAKAIGMTTKMTSLIHLLGEGMPGFFDPAAKLLIFTQFRETQNEIARCLKEIGTDFRLFHGSLNRLEKEMAIRDFENKAQVLVSTESGGEGRNLQFCHALLNYDLPWNPMRIEQRVGRISRIGQKKEVLLLNYSTADTIESAILELLDGKINLFELVVGEIGMILGKIEEERPFEELVFDHWIHSHDTQEFHQRMGTLGDQLVQARNKYQETVIYENKLFGANPTNLEKGA